MRAFILALALTFTVGLTACESEQADAIDDRGDAIEEAYDEAADQVDETIEEGAPAGDQEDVLGDGEVFDEEGEPEADETM